MVNPTFLTDQEFRSLATAGHGVVQPFNADYVQAASVDLRLGNYSYKYRFETYTLGQEIGESDYETETFEDLTLDPGSSCFIGIEEQIDIPQDCLGLLYARSSITRLGLVIQPIYFSPGYSGRPPLTIFNSTDRPMRIVPRVRVAQLICARLGNSPSVGYDMVESSKYVNEDVAPSRLHTDAEIKAALDRVLKKALPNHLLART